MLEDVPPDRHAVPSCLQRIVHHVQYVEIGAHLRAPCDYHWHHGASHHIAEGIDVARVAAFDKVCSELHRDPCCMRDGLGIEGILDARAAGVCHHDQRHPPFGALARYHAEIAEHLRLRLGTDVDMHRYGVRTELECLFHGCDQDLGVRAHADVRGSGQVQYQANIVACGPVTLRDDPLMHQDRCGPALDHVADRALHVDKPGDRSRAYTMVHGHDHRIATLSVYNPLHPDTLAEHIFHRATC